mmetsp:Transcript_78533/g.139300  ORF Transcript_78533/g.139300 Transcript_78533/m.139300 type:complete len:114 (+) Transcript_78533:254-595(+)
MRIKRQEGVYYACIVVLTIVYNQLWSASLQGFRNDLLIEWHGLQLIISDEPPRDFMNSNLPSAFEVSMSKPSRRAIGKTRDHKASPEPDKMPISATLKKLSCQWGSIFARSLA